MLLLLLLWTALLLSCSAIGYLLLHLIGDCDFVRTGDRLIVSVWLGLTVISVSLLGIANLAPLVPAGGVLIVVSACLAFIHPVPRRALRAVISRLSPPEFAGALVLASSAAVLTSDEVMVYDTGLYHYGAIRWLSQFGTVPGLALLQPRFGFASSWFALSAALDLNLFESRTCQAVGGLALLLATGHGLLCLSRCVKRQGDTADWFIVTASALFIPLTVHKGTEISPSPDLPIIILTVLVAWTFLIVSSRNSSLVPVILSLGAVTMKLSAAPLAAVSCAFYLYRWRGSTPAVVRLGLISLLILVPMVAYHVITSGYPFFPLPVCRVALPWTLGQEQTELLTRAITSWARWDGPAPSDANALNWFWRRWLVPDGTYKSRAFYAGASCLCLGLAMTRFKRVEPCGRLLKWAGIATLGFILLLRMNNLLMLVVFLLAVTSRRRSRGREGWVLLTGVLGLAFIMWRAPDFRFGLGYVAVLWGSFAVGGAGAVENFLRRAGRGVSFATLLVLAGLILGLYHYKPRLSGHPSSTDEPNALFIPPRLSQVATERTRINNVEYFKPVQGDQCWAAPLPCSPGGPEDRFTMPSDIQLLDQARGISAGFRHSEQPVQPLLFSPERRQ